MAFSISPESSGNQDKGENEMGFDRAALLARIAASKASQKGNNINPGGVYLWEVLKLLIINGHNGDFFIAELYCRESKATGELNRAGQPWVPMQVGQTGSVCVNLSDPKQESAPGNVKSFMMGLMGEPESAIDLDVLGWATNEDPTKGAVNPCRGMLIRDEAFNRPQKKDPSRDFTHHRWVTVEQSPEQIAARRKDLDEARL
jgi:hypothetical protein